jgi:hypothetical protein
MQKASQPRLAADSSFAALGMRAAGWQSFGWLEGPGPESLPQLMLNVGAPCKFGASCKVKVFAE